jgi:NADPH:quinone reductase-like Zn-dependent oxidoreductase
MKAIVLRSPGGLDRMELNEMPDPGPPGPGEIRVRLHASSLNYHDYLVATGRIRTADGRIPMSDGAGVVEAVGEGVSEFTVGDGVISCFFPAWQDGPPAIGDFSTVPGDGVDGYAREAAVRPATWFTPAPRPFSPAEAGLDHALSHCLYYAGAIRHRNAPVRRSDPSGCDEVGADLTPNKPGYRA